MQNELAIAYDEMIDRVEAQMMEIGESEFETSGFFCGGIYVKSIVIPAGSYLTSRVHKQEHPYVLSAGTITIYTQGGEMTLTAPHVGITLAGTRRFAKAETDCLWTCFHRTDKQTHEDVEEEVVEPIKNKLLMNKEVLQ